MLVYLPVADNLPEFLYDALLTFFSRKEELIFLTQLGVRLIEFSVISGYILLPFIVTLHV